MQKSTFDYVFISCVKMKSENAILAKDLYISPLFKKAYAYAMKYVDEDKIFILSAKYGLLPALASAPPPYEMTLKNKSKEQRKLWAYNIYLEMQKQNISTESKILILAGMEYREFICRFLPNSFCPVTGLSIGRMLKFYNAQI